jgi:hypothetical protein
VDEFTKIRSDQIRSHRVNGVSNEESRDLVNAQLTALLSRSTLLS